MYTILNHPSTLESAVDEQLTGKSKKYHNPVRSAHLCSPSPLQWTESPLQSLCALLSLTPLFLRPLAH